jgi:hypothetical protein
MHDMLIDLINGNKQGSNELNMLATWTISLINDLRKNVVGWQDLIPSPGLNSLEKMELYFSLIEGKHLPSYL